MGKGAKRNSKRIFLANVQMRIIVIVSFEELPQYIRETLHNIELILEEFFDYDSGIKFAISNDISIILVYEKQSYLEKIELFCRQGPDEYLPVTVITKITHNAGHQLFLRDKMALSMPRIKNNEEIIKVVERIKADLVRDLKNREFYNIEDLVLDLSKQRAERGGKRLDLTKGEFSLLLEFMRRSGQVLSREYLAVHVWKKEGEFTKNMVDVAVRRLRKKLDDNHVLKLLHTRRGAGYILEVPISKELELRSTTINSETQAP